MWAINLGDLNTWLDVAFSTVEALVFVGLIAHFLGGILYGRFRKQWLEGVWLIHDGHPTTLRKIMHVTNLTMFLTLIFTGLALESSLLTPRNARTPGLKRSGKSVITSTLTSPRIPCGAMMRPIAR